MTSAVNAQTEAHQRFTYGSYKLLRNVTWLPNFAGAVFAAATRKRWPTGILERHGLYTGHRPPSNPLIWFHTHSAGECMLCLPLLHRVIVEYNEKVLILLTVQCAATLRLLRSSLPERVVVVRAPVDAPLPVRRFLRHWRPCLCVMLTAWLPPTLIMTAHAMSVPLALLDASAPKGQFHRCHDRRGARALSAVLAAAFSLIIPHSDVEVGRFRLLGARLSQMPGWCNDLSYACALSTVVANLWRPSARAAATLEAQFKGRAAWLACNLTATEEAALPTVHAELAAEFPALLTVYAPHDGSQLAVAEAAFAAAGRVAFASAMPASLDDVSVLLVDTPWALPLLMSVCELAHLGAAPLPGDQNYALLSQAALSSCAIVASGAVAAHAQLAQELNTAAVTAAEDTANAVRTAGVDLDVHTPWREATHSGAGSEPSDAAGVSPSAVSTAVGSTSAATTASSAAATSPAPLSPTEARAAVALVAARNSAARSEAAFGVVHTHVHGGSTAAGSIPSHPGTPAASPPRTPRVPSAQVSLSARNPSSTETASNVSPGAQQPELPSAAAALRDADCARSSSSSDAGAVEDELSTQLVAHDGGTARIAPALPRHARVGACAPAESRAFGSRQGAACDAAGSSSEAEPVVPACSEAEAPRAQLSLDSPTAGGRLFMNAFNRSPAQPTTPSQSGAASHTSVTHTPVGLPLSRSPTPLRRLRPSVSAGAAANGSIREDVQQGSVTHAASMAALYAHPYASLGRGSSGSSPSADTTPTALTMSVHPSACVLQRMPAAMASVAMGEGQLAALVPGQVPIVPQIADGSMGSCPLRSSAMATPLQQHSAQQACAPPWPHGASPKRAAQLGPASLVEPEAKAQCCGGGDASTGVCAPGLAPRPRTAPVDAADDAGVPLHRLRSGAAVPADAPASRRLSTAAEAAVLAESGAVVAVAPAPSAAGAVVKDGVDAPTLDAASMAAAPARSMISSERLPSTAALASITPTSCAPCGTSTSAIATDSVARSGADHATPTAARLAQPLSPVTTPCGLQRVRTPMQSTVNDDGSCGHSAAGEAPVSAPLPSAPHAAQPTSSSQLPPDVQPGSTDDTVGSRGGSLHLHRQDESMDLWAGASPYMRHGRGTAFLRPTTASSAHGSEACHSEHRSEGACLHVALPHDVHIPVHEEDEEAEAQVASASTQSPENHPYDREARVTMRRALLRYHDRFLLSARQLLPHPEGPAVWLLGAGGNLAEVIGGLLREPVSRQSRGHIAVQAAARLSTSLVSTIWDVLDGTVLEPALLAFEGAQSRATHSSAGVDGARGSAAGA